MEYSDNQVLAGERVGTGISSARQMSDIQPENLETPARAYMGKEGRILRPDVPIPKPPKPIPKPKGTSEVVHVNRKQLPDQTVFSFDEMTDQPELVTIAATPTRVTVLQTQLRAGIEGKITKFGWYTNVGGRPLLLFGLFINDDLAIPQGKYIGGRGMERTSVYEPSGVSINPGNLVPVNIPIPAEANVKIVVQTNGGGAGIYPVFARIIGEHWQVRKDEEETY